MERAALRQKNRGEAGRSSALWRGSRSVVSWVDDSGSGMVKELEGTGFGRGIGGAAVGAGVCAREGGRQACAVSDRDAHGGVRVGLRSLQNGKVGLRAV
jgi:hypothetical protein